MKRIDLSYKINYLKWKFMEKEQYQTNCIIIDNMIVLS